MSHSPTIVSASGGFTLVEALIAVAVLMIGVLVLEKNVISSLTNNAASRRSAVATSFASSQLEHLQARPFDDAATAPFPQLNDVNNDGINGLNNTVAVNGDVLADHAMVWNSQDQSGGRNAIPRYLAQGENLTDAGPWDFVLFWNIDNSGDRQKKEIRLICRWRDAGRGSNIDQTRIPAKLEGGSLREYLARFGNQELVLRYVKADI
ncbi:MAG: hypothetical protein LBH14_01355 [Desulfobulbaceae bacterium]|jgi:Tfp pilus assembly protein PilV|nr:hypothetical protein [Desulfobulbaceae bacterium]